MSGSGLLELGAFMEANILRHTYSDSVRQTLWIMKKSRITGNNGELTLEQFNAAVDYSVVKYKVTYLKDLFGGGGSFLLCFTVGWLFLL